MNRLKTKSEKCSEAPKKIYIEIAEIKKQIYERSLESERALLFLSSMCGLSSEKYINIKMFQSKHEKRLFSNHHSIDFQYGEIRNY